MQIKPVAFEDFHFHQLGGLNEKTGVFFSTKFFSAISYQTTCDCSKKGFPHLIWFYTFEEFCGQVRRRSFKSVFKVAEKTTKHGKTCVFAGAKNNKV